jgi:hypothetical protein
MGSGPDAFSRSKAVEHLVLKEFQQSPAGDAGMREVKMLNLNRG